MAGQVYVIDSDKVSALSVGGGGNIEISTTDADVAAATSGDLIIYYELVGVALGDYDTVNDSIVVAIEGGYELEVVAEGAAGDEAVRLGSWVYYDAADDELNRDSTNGVPIGIALAEIDAGDTETIGVRLIPVPPTYE